MIVIFKPIIRIFIFSIFLFISNINPTFADPKFFNLNVGRFIDTSKIKMTNINIPSDFMDSLKTYGIPKHYFLNDINNISDEFNKINITTILLFSDFYQAIKKIWSNPKTLHREVLLKLKAQNKNIFSNFGDCEIRRKATMIEIEKKYFNEGYRTSITPGKLQSSTDEVNIFTENEDSKLKNHFFYRITSKCVLIDKSPIFAPNEKRKDANLLNKLFKKKDDNFIFYLEIESIKSQLLIKELYSRYLDGKFTEVSLEGL